MSKKVLVRATSEQDVPLILNFIRELAVFERMSDRVTATEAELREYLFGPRIYAESLIAELDGVPEGFALFFHNFSTFVGRPGIYLEDLFVREAARGNGIGLELLKRVAQICVERGGRRVDWAVLDWNSTAIEFYERIGAKPEQDWKIYRLTGEPLATLARRQQG